MASLSAGDGAAAATQMSATNSSAASTTTLSASSLTSTPASTTTTLPAINQTATQPTPATVNSMAPFDSPRPLTTHYLSSSTSLAVQPLLDIPFSLLDPNLSADELSKLLLDVHSSHHTLHALKQHTQLLHASLVECKRRLDTVTASRGQSVAYLQREILSKERAINDLIKERMAMVSDVEAVKDKCREEVREERARVKEDKRRLESELSVIKGSYTNLKEFAYEKKALQDEITQLKSLLDEEKRAHNRDVCELERRNILEKEKMKNNMLLKIRDTKLTLLAQTEDQLSMITKRTMLENQQIITELMYQSKETEKMERAYTDMVRREDKWVKEVELWKLEKQQMNEKLVLYSKMIKQYQQREKEWKEHGKGEVEEEKEDVQIGHAVIKSGSKSKR